MVDLDLTFRGVSIPTGSGGVDVTVEEDSDADGTVETTETLSLSDGVTSYSTSSGAFAASGEVRLTLAVGAPTDPTVTASVVGPVQIEGPRVLNAPVQTLGLGHPPASIGSKSWVIGGERTGTSTAETRTPQTLTLQQRVTTSVLQRAWRPLKTDEGKVDVFGTDDGGFVAVGRADGGNTFQIKPPTNRKQLRQNGTYHVQRYEEDLVSQTVDEWDVEVEFVAAADRTDTPSLSQSPATDEWGINTRYGEIATSRVDADVVGTGEGGVQRIELRARLTFKQAHVFEAALSRVGAGRVRSVPDAPNVAVDDSSDNAATVTLDTPDSQTVVSDGEYVVTGWESTRLTDAYQEVSMTLASK